MITFKQIRHFNIASDGFLQKDPKNLQTKLGYAIAKLQGGDIKKALTAYQNGYQELYYENVEKVAIDQALTDKATGAILTAPKDSDRPYLYSKQGLKNLIETERGFQKLVTKFNEDFDLKEFEVSPFIVSESPELSDVEKEAFKGLVIDDNTTFISLAKE